MAPFNFKVLERDLQTGIKALQYDFSQNTRLKTLVICQVTDVHYGVKSVSRNVIESYRDFILAEPNRFMVWTGDMINAATPYSKGHPHDDSCGPKQQIEEFCRIWRVGNAHERVLGYVGGNHELRAIAEYADLGPEIADRLSIPYSSDFQEIRIRFNADYDNRSHRAFAIMQHHRGIGGQKTSLAGMITERPDNDVYLAGHYHRFALEAITRKRRGADGISWLEVVYGLRGSSFMEQYTPYAAAAGHKLSRLQMPSMVLGRQGEVMCCPNDEIALKADAGLRAESSPRRRKAA